MNFAVFILSHGRADNVITYQTLRRLGYTGRIYLIVDTEDSQISEYKQNFGDVVVFDKSAMKFDNGDNFNNRLMIIYARNQCFKIAKDLGLDYFLELDDDYVSFQYRWVEDKKLKVKECSNLDAVFMAMVEFLKASGADTVALAQGGDFIGGSEAKNVQKPLLRKAMNSFFCRADKPFTFVGGINEDVSTYCSLGSRGHLFLTVTAAMIEQKTSQTNKGGMTEYYQDNGTYTKSFYSVMYCPSFVKIGVMGDAHKRIHHQISWNNAVPKIIGEEHRK